MTFDLPTILTGLLGQLLGRCPVCGAARHEPHKATMGKPYRDVAGHLVAKELHG